MKDTLKLACLMCGQTNRVPANRLELGPKCGTCGATLVEKSVTEVDPRIHDKATMTDELPLVVDYWAPWCGPCRMMAPEFSKAANALEAKARFAKINTEQFPQVSQKLSIRGIPLLILYKKGKEVARLSGARPASDIQGFVLQNS